MYMRTLQYFLELWVCNTVSCNDQPRRWFQSIQMDFTILSSKVVLTIVTC